MATNLGFSGSFMSANLENGFEAGPSMPLLSRYAGATLSPELRDEIAAINRGDFSGDINKVLGALGDSFSTLERTITSATSAFPVRENLEAEAKILIPTDTPVRNLLPRVPGSGTAIQWRQLTSFGGGWGSGYDQGGGGSAAQVFYGETGAPAAVDSAYAAKSAGYKLLGVMGSVSGFAMAAGQNFQNQLAVEKTNKLRNLMLLEEFALINGSSTSTAAPFGNGTTAFGYDGLINLVTTANGTPAAQVQTAIGALTLAHIDAQLNRLFAQGGSGHYMLVNMVEATSLAHLAQASGSINRILIDNQGSAVINTRVSAYIHPTTGEPVDIIVSRFVPAGTILFCSRYLPDGSPAAQVNVLPQVQYPAIPGERIEGYVARDIAPTATAPDVFQFLVSVYEVLQLKSALHFCKSSGVTAV
jgi:hypothetical protein